MATLPELSVMALVSFGVLVVCLVLRASLPVLLRLVLWAVEAVEVLFLVQAPQVVLVFDVLLVGLVLVLAVLLALVVWAALAV